MISLWSLCLVTLSVQKIGSDAAVTSQSITTEPRHGTEGKTVTLTCSATCDNNTVCAYTWSGFSTTTSKGSILLLNVDRTYRNKPFTCSVTDTGDSHSATTSTQFDVYYGPDSVTINVDNLAVDEGAMSDDHPVACVANDCNPACNLIWSDNTVALQTKITSQLRLFQTNTVYLRNTAGTYTCQAKNTIISKTQSSSIVLTVRYPPVVTLTATNENTLECEAIGVPSTYTFNAIKHYISSTLVRQLQVKKIANKATVTLAGSYQDTGRYECSANNGITHYTTKLLEQTDDYYATFDDSPVLVTSTESYNVSKGDTLTIELTVYSLPALDDVSVTSGLYSISPVEKISTHAVQIECYGTTVITPGHMVLLEFSDVLEDYFRTFTISLSNSLGTLSMNVTIYPEGPPDIPVNFTKVDSSHEYVVFTIVTGFFNGGAQTMVLEYRHAWYQLDWVNGTFKYAGVQKNQQIRLEVHGLAPETMYAFRVYSYNEFDNSGYSVEINEKTMEAPIAVGLILAILGGVAVLAIIVVVVIFLTRRMLQRNKDHDSGTHTELNTDITAAIPNSYVNENTIPSSHVNENTIPSSYVNVNTIPSSHVNENTIICTKKPIPLPTKSIIYENTKLEAGQEVTPERRADKSDHTVYYNTTILEADTITNTNSTLNANYDSPRAPYLVLNNAAIVEEAYLDTNEAKQLFDQNNKQSPVNKQDADEEDYLDMNDMSNMNTKHLIKPSSGHSNTIEATSIDNQSFDKPYDNIELNKSKKDYQNVAHLRKNVVQTPIPGKGGLGKEPKDYRHVPHYKRIPQLQARVESQRDTYVSMSPGRARKSVVSVPDFEAPPPPPRPEEEQYMNVRLHKPS